MRRSVSSSFSPLVERGSGFVRRHYLLVSLAVLGIIVSIVYLPALLSYFIADDFEYLYLLVFGIKGILSGDNWREWYFKSITGYIYFRPVGHTLMLVDYIAWGMNALGHHVTSIILHALTSFEVLLIALRTTRSRVSAGIAAALFAVMAVHSSAVAWVAARYDVICGFWYLASVLFFILYRQKGRAALRAFSIVAFVMALSSKELAITLPGMLVLYDVLFHLKRLSISEIWGLVRRQIPFAVTLGLYLAMRLNLYGFIANRGTEYMLDGWWPWVDATLINLFDPIWSEFGPEVRWGLLIVLALVLVLARKRRAMLYGLAWIPIAYFLTITTNASDYSFYVASLGPALVLGDLLGHWTTSRSIWRQRAAFALGAIIVVGYVSALEWRIQEFNRASQVAAAIPQQVKALYPTLPKDARLVFVGVPDRIPTGTLVYLAGFQAAMRITYDNPALRVYKYDKFPLWTDNLESSHFFLVDHRRVMERPDVLRSLQAYQKCRPVAEPAVTWDFSRDPQGWEAWNELGELGTSNGMLVTRALGNDPYLASPRFDIPTERLGDIEITMSATAEQQTLQGEVYWLGAGDADFAPDSHVPFTIKADGQLRTYHVDLVSTDKLLMDEHIVRMRLDPANAPADLKIQSVRIFALSCGN